MNAAARALARVAEAVKRLEAIEAAAQALFVDSPDLTELPEDEWDPLMLALRTALLAPQADKETQT